MAQKYTLKNPVFCLDNGEYLKLLQNSLFEKYKKRQNNLYLRLGSVGSYRPNFVQNTRSHHTKSSTYEVSPDLCLQNT